MAGPEPVVLPWAVVHAFVRIGTNARIMHPPEPIASAMETVAGWLARPSVSPLLPGARYWSILRELAVATNSCGDLMGDAHLAALAIEHGALLCSADRDFSRFPGLRWMDPLAQGGRR